MRQVGGNLQIKFHQAGEATLPVPWRLEDQFLDPVLLHRVDVLLLALEHGLGLGAGGPRMAIQNALADQRAAAIRLQARIGY